MKMPLARLLFRRLVSCSLKSCVLLLPVLATAASNVAPTVAISSAVMRPGTTLMDVTYQITDPDDATVKVRALAFVNGLRSFANVIRPVTWAEGTEAYIGDTITPNVNHTLTWDVAADWNIQLGQVKFEVLAVDSNGVLPFQGITIPAAAGQPELTINQVGLTDPQVFNALLWFYASGNAYMEVTNGTLVGSATSGVFRQRPVVEGAAINQQNAQPFLFKLLDISPAGTDLLNYADFATRSQFIRNTWLTTNRPYVGTQFVYAWGYNMTGQINIPPTFRNDAIAIAAGGYHSLALLKNGTVIGWGDNSSGQTSVPAGLSGVTAIGAGGYHSLALKNDGTVVAWGAADVPAGLSGVTAIAAGFDHSSLALKNDGTVVAWGNSDNGQTTIPAGLSSVIAISAGDKFGLALKSDGTVVGWGANSSGQTTIPSGLSGVTAIATGWNHSLALKNDGTLVAWGGNEHGHTTIPAGLSGVTAIAAGEYFSVALKNDGTVVAWGYNGGGSTAVPAGLSGVTAITANGLHVFAIAEGP
jgi:hypothetical protein